MDTKMIFGQKHSFTAMVFLRDESNRQVHYSATSISAAEALGELEKCGRKFVFRPGDGTIYLIGSHIPCGVIFCKGYAES